MKKKILDKLRYANKKLKGKTVEYKNYSELKVSKAKVKFIGLYKYYNGPKPAAQMSDSSVVKLKDIILLKETRNKAIKEMTELRMSRNKIKVEEGLEYIRINLNEIRKDEEILKKLKEKK